MDELNETMVNDTIEASDVIEAVADHGFNPKVAAGVGLGAVVVAVVAVAVTKRNEIKTWNDDRKAKRETKKAAKIRKRAERHANVESESDIKSEQDEK